VKKNSADNGLARESPQKRYNNSKPIVFNNNETTAMSLPDINADLNRLSVVTTASMSWEPSPSDTVWRKPLYRQGGEFGPVTSLVRYTAGGAFSAHFHPEGEEILVLDGGFSDEHGDYSAGSYLLNPDGSRHAPYSQSGCTLFVRLRQYAGAQRLRVVFNTADLDWLPGGVSGLMVKPLYSQAVYPERMALVRWKPGAHFPRHSYPGGGEILVLEGLLEDEHGCYPPGTWIRRPSWSQHATFSRRGCMLYVRIGGPMTALTTWIGHTVAAENTLQG
jgi:anti-sigma factor ChrR (cupin superfamily)